MDVNVKMFLDAFLELGVLAKRRKYRVCQVKLPPPSLKKEGDRALVRRVNAVKRRYYWVRQAA